MPKRKKQPLILLASPGEYESNLFRKLQDQGYLIKSDNSVIPSTLAGQGASIIYLNQISELGYEGNWAEEIRKSNLKVKICLLNLTYSTGGMFENFLRECEEDDSEVREYLKNVKGSHAIQGSPDVDTLHEIIEATLNDTTPNTNYERTRVVIP